MIGFIAWGFALFLSISAIVNAVDYVEWEQDYSDWK